MMRSIFLLAACVATPALAAQPVYKCTAEGKTSYSDRPCAGGPSTVLPPVAGGIRPEGAESAPGQDARALLELEKLNIRRQNDIARETARESARRQAQEKREQEREDARADRSYARNVKAAEARRKQCDRLRLRAKWADEDLARARGKAREQARIKAKRAQETMAVECPA